MDNRWPDMKTTPRNHQGEDLSRPLGIKTLFPLRPRTTSPRPRAPTRHRSRRPGRMATDTSGERRLRMSHAVCMVGNRPHASTTFSSTLRIPTRNSELSTHGACANPRRDTREAARNTNPSLSLLECSKAREISLPRGPAVNGYSVPTDTLRHGCACVCYAHGNATIH